MCVLEQSHNRLVTLLKQEIPVSDIAVAMNVNIETVKKYIKKHSLAVFKAEKPNLLHIAQNPDFQRDFKDSSCGVGIIAEKYQISSTQVYYCGRIAQIHRNKPKKQINFKKTHSKISLLPTDNQCHYIHEDGKNAYFCSNKQMTHSVFCEEHTKICYVKFKSKKIRRHHA